MGEFEDPWEDEFESEEEIVRDSDDEEEEEELKEIENGENGMVYNEFA